MFRGKDITTGKYDINIFLDGEGTAKLSGFNNSVLIPEEENFVEDLVVEGTFGYLDHNYMATGIVTENTDVHGFGTFMFTLLPALQPSLVVKLLKMVDSLGLLIQRWRAARRKR
ncbi:unnamed protein product [Eruca vesicaria subsp. sativa]|uniref:Uncharacterized protein n=1 Tax=Eruca vesicaria subsp. sativa TaxID=29727 RepID=A0ABC8LNM3_ERUVS|nr:unnamed protein product [Eruca vesicaria subsp. sativa]